MGDDINSITKNAETRMGRCINSLRQDLAGIRTGRANPSILDGVVVPYYGKDVPLNQVATVSITDGTSLLVRPYDRASIGPIEKALLASDLGINPTNTGTDIRLNFPPPTEERRKELAKNVDKEGEKAKVAIRNVRRDAKQHVDRLVKDKTFTEDDKRRAENAVQKLTDRFVKDVDNIVKAKEKELMSL